MRRLFHLANCTTCQRIIAEWQPPADVVQQNIKTEAITAAQLDEMARLAGGFEPLFSRKAMKYKSMGLAERTLSEADYRRLILEEYTFLKRPVLVLGEQVFIGNAPKTVKAAGEALRKGA